MKKAIAIVVGLLAVAALIVALFFTGKSELQEFDENGRYKIARIDDLYSKQELNTQTSKWKIETVHYADINYFVRESDSRNSKVTTSIADNNGEELMINGQKLQSMEEILAAVEKLDIEIGDLWTNQLKLSKRQFEAHQGKKHIEILYLKDEPNKIILKSLLD